MIVLFVAIITVHLPNGFSSIKLQTFDAAGAHFGQPGYEIALCFGGPGPISVDGWLNRLLGRVAGGKARTARAFAPSWTDIESNHELLSPIDQKEYRDAIVSVAHIGG